MSNLFHTNDPKKTIVIPMAGAGSRFLKQGYKTPKPFIEFKGRMMIEHVLQGVYLKKTQYILIIPKIFEIKYKKCLHTISKNFHVIFLSVEQMTTGSASTVLAAHSLIDNDDPILIADCDNIFNPNDIISLIKDAEEKNLCGNLLTFNEKEQCYSYAKIDKHGFVVKTEEKKVISSHAIAGAYYFSHGKDFVSAAIRMLIYGNIKKGEFYMSNVVNFMKKKRVGIYKVERSRVSCVGTPEQLEEYLNRE
ncbi:MAG: sugar phosphate nucleotidyltransferase [Halobacteriovoraceae bacterium]|nr:sugar phosphate nucleotidyltransferase [Halobacteriovoraceae bacterium]